ncbi:MAG TPA: hypothetical protein DCR93_37415, partial [Cytophagales bacterium]|nr:hypothetical protein [Cytophagales bacterium]
LVVGLSVLLIAGLRPYYEAFSGFSTGTFSGMALWGLLLVLALLGLGFLGTSYSGAYLSFAKPLVPSTSSRLPLLKQVLLGFQYTLAASILVITLAMGRQLDYLRSKDLGFAQEQLMMVSLPEGEEDTYSQIVQLRDALQTQASLQRVALIGGGALPGEENGKDLFEVKGPEGTVEKVYDIYRVDHQYLEALDIPLAAGRNFDATRPQDASGTVMINEALARAIGWENPLGQYIGYYGEWREIIGVVKDFHHQSLHNPIEPIVLLYGPEAARTLLVKAPLSAAKTLETTYATYFPDTPFSLRYFDQFIGAMYAQEQQLTQLFRFFSFVALLLCGMGLFALFSLHVHQRTQEISIRKVLGAEARHLLGNLFRAYRYPIVIALVVGLPLAGWGVQYWLHTFTYRVSMGGGIYVAAVVGILGVSLGVTGYHILKALRVNPAESLKQEG